MKNKKRNSALVIPISFCKFTEKRMAEWYTHSDGTELLPGLGVNPGIISRLYFYVSFISSCILHEESICRDGYVNRDPI